MNPDHEIPVNRSGIANMRDALPAQVYLVERYEGDEYKVAERAFTFATDAEAYRRGRNSQQEGAGMDGVTFGIIEVKLHNGPYSAEDEKRDRYEAAKQRARMCLSQDELNALGLA